MRQKQSANLSLIDTVAEYAIHAIAALIPLALISTTQFLLYESPKVAVLNIFTLVALAAWVCGMFRSGIVRLRRPPFLIPVLAYFAVYTAATIFSLSPVLSIFGIVDRNMGLINLANLILLYFLGFNILTTQEQQLRCLKILVLSVTVVSLFGVLQYFGINPFNLLPYLERQRVGSTLGNADYCTPVVLLGLPVALAFVLKKRFLFAVPFVLISMMLLFSLPIHGLTGRWLIESPEEAMAGVQGEQSSTAGVLARVAVERIQVREGIWEAGWKAAAERPVLGSGPNTFRDVFTLHEPLSYVRMLPTFREDKVHNEFLEVAQSTGFLGLAAYLWMLGAAVWYFVSWIWRNRKGHNAVVVAAVVAGIIGYLGYTFLLFHTIAAYTLFWMLLMLGAGLCQPPEVAEVRKKVKVLQSLAPTLGIIVLVVVGVLGFTALRPVFAAVSFARAQQIPIQDLATGTAATEWYRKAADWHGYDYYYLRFAAHALSNLGVSTKSSPVTDPKFQDAFYYIDRAARQEPYNATVYYNRALIYQRSGRSVEEVLADLYRAVDLYPYYAMAYDMIGDVEGSRGEYEKAIAALQQELYILPGETRAMAKLGYNYMQVDRVAEAIEVMERATQLGDKDAKLFFNLGVAYEKKDDLTKARQAYEEAVQADPKLIQAKVALQRLGGG